MPNTNCLEGVICPQCGQEDRFKIDACITVLVTDSGTEDQGGDYEWSANSFTQCCECDYSGALKTFCAPPA